MNQKFSSEELGEWFRGALHNPKELSSNTRNPYVRSNGTLNNSTQYSQYVRNIRQFIDNPDPNEFDSIMKQCTIVRDLSLAKEFHSASVKAGITFEKKQWNNLINMYSKCNNGLQCALQVFHDMQKYKFEPSVFTFTALINAFGNNGMPDKAHDVLHEMLRKGIVPDVVTWTTLISAYAKSGNPEEANNVLRHMLHLKVKPNLVTWNTLIKCYGQSGRSSEVRGIISEMQRNGIKPNVVTFTAAIASYVQSGNFVEARRLLDEMMESGIKPDVVTWTTLLNAYGQNGNADDAYKTLHEMQKNGIQPNVVTWTALIDAYALHGNGTKALQLLEEMQKSGTAPNESTFSCVLSACNRGGMIEEAMALFHRLKSDFGVIPNIVHETCIVDMLSRAGKLDEAERFLNKMKRVDCGTWKALLSGCLVHRDLKRAELAAQRALEFDSRDSFVYLMLLESYALSKQFEKEAEVRRIMKQRHIQHIIGQSFIEINGNRHLFIDAQT